MSTRAVYLFFRQKSIYLARKAIFSMKLVKFCTFSSIFHIHTEKICIIFLYFTNVTEVFYFALFTNINTMLESKRKRWPMKNQSIDMGMRIKSRRKELKKTQGQLAEEVGISNNHMSSIENGKYSPSFETFIQICQCLNVRPDYLLLGTISSCNVPQNIIENLQLCSERDLEFILRITSYLVELNTNNRTIDWTDTKK